MLHQNCRAVFTHANTKKIMDWVYTVMDCHCFPTRQLSSLALVLLLFFFLRKKVSTISLSSLRRIF